MLVHASECLGEMSLLRRSAHMRTAVARTEVEAAVLPYGALLQLVKRRPDIGATIFRNLAHGLTEKLARVDEKLLE